MKNVGFIIICLILVLNSFSQLYQLEWQACFGGFDRDYATDIVATDNGYIIIGTIYSDSGDITNNHGSKDIWLTRVDSIGNLLWERAYGGSNTDYQGVVTSDFEGNFYFCGTVYSNDGDVQSGNHGDYDVWVVKIDPDGEIIWEKCYGGSGREDIPSMELQSNGDILISCSSTSDDGDLPTHYHAYDAWLFVISPNGEILKNAVFGNDLHNNVYDAIGTQDGGFFFTCGASSNEGMVEGTYHGGMLDVWVVKLDSNMNIEWQMLYGGSDWDYGSFGIHGFSEGYIFLAHTNSNDDDVSGYHGTTGEARDIWAVRIDLEGNIIWQRCLGGSDYESAGDLFQTEDGGFVIFGATMSNNGDVSGNHSYPNWGWSDIWMVKLSGDGELEWQQCYGSYGDDKVYGGVVQKSDYNWVIAGSASYNSDDVNCNLHFEYMEDYWVFEIKDTSTNIVNDQIDGVGIKVYPNPAKDFVMFEARLPDGQVQSSEFNLKGNNSITVINAIGQQVASLPVKSEVTMWDTREMKSGIYFYNIEINDKIKNGKIIITK